MSYVVFFSGLFFTYGWAFAIFFLVITKSAQLVILAIGSSFFWLLSILLASMIVAMIPPIRDAYAWIIPVSVILQEVARYGFCHLYYKAYSKLSFGSTRDDTTKPSNFLSALTVGWGFGFTSSLILYTSIMWGSTGPGFFPTPACKSISVFHIGSLNAQAFIMLHVLWTIIGFDAYLRRTWWKIGFILVSHLLASFLTLFNLHGGSCLGSILGVYAVLGFVGIATWKVITTNNTLLLYSKNSAPIN